MSNNRTIDTVWLAAACKALANPHRLRIFLHLATCCPPGTVFAAPPAGCVCVGKLGDELPIAPSTLSHHLKELNRAGLVRMQRRGRHIDCWIDPDAVAALAAAFRFDAPPVFDLGGAAKEKEHTS